MADGGISGAQAYREHVSRGKCAPATAWAGASALLRPGHEVAIRVKELHTLSETLAEERLCVSKVEVMAWLSEVMRTSIFEVDGSSTVCQHYSEEHTAHGTSRRIVMVDKIGAVRLLSEMCDWVGSGRGSVAPLRRACEPVNLDLDSLVDLLCESGAEMGFNAAKNPLAKDLAL